MDEIERKCTTTAAVPAVLFLKRQKQMCLYNSEKAEHRTVSCHLMITVEHIVISEMNIQFRQKAVFNNVRV